MYSAGSPLIYHCGNKFAKAVPGQMVNAMFFLEAALLSIPSELISCKGQCNEIC
jgi:hypothetical protein